MPRGKSQFTFQNEAHCPVREGGAEWVVRSTAVKFATGKPANRLSPNVTALICWTTWVTFTFQSYLLCLPLGAHFHSRWPFLPCSTAILLLSFQAHLYTQEAGLSCTSYLTPLTNASHSQICCKTSEPKSNKKKNRHTQWTSSHLSSTSHLLFSLPAPHLCVLLPRRQTRNILSRSCRGWVPRNHLLIQFCLAHTTHNGSNAMMVLLVNILFMLFSKSQYSPLMCSPSLRKTALLTRPSSWPQHLEWAMLITQCFLHPSSIHHWGSMPRKSTRI